MDSDAERLREVEERLASLEKEVERVKELEERTVALEQEVRLLKDLLEKQVLKEEKWKRQEEDTEDGREGEGDGSGVREAWMKPSRQGWVREVVVRGTDVTNIRYLGPGGRAVSRRTMATFLADPEASGGLERSNFTFQRKLLGLGEGREVRRASAGGVFGRSPYRQFFTEQPDHQGRSMVTCNLCKKDISRANFSRHMKEHHLPEEQCEACGKEFRALDIGKHRKLCGGLEKVPSPDMSGMMDSVNLTHVEQNIEVISSGEEDEIKITEVEINKDKIKSEDQAIKMTKPDEQLIKITLKFEGMGMKKRLIFTANSKTLVKKIMKKSATHWKKPLSSLRFCVEDKVLTGEEEVGSIGRKTIIVTE